MLILANPTNDLASAYLEGLHIKKQIDAQRDRLFVDFKSTHIDTMYVKKNLRDYDIVHFAGHCEYDLEDAKKSGWLLADGKLSAQDILTMGQTRALPSLVFSNGCLSANDSNKMSGFARQEETYSLASAFLFSGVSHYIGTIRKIEDPASCSFAKEFYRRLIEGDAVGESLRSAREKLSAEFGEASFFWTSYLLYGDPNFVLFERRLQPPAVASGKRLPSRINYSPGLSR
jgi:CHAT domain-containing protein